MDKQQYAARINNIIVITTEAANQEEAHVSLLKFMGISMQYLVEGQLPYTNWGGLEGEVQVSLLNRPQDPITSI